jgi:hypothetical protein
MASTMKPQNHVNEEPYEANAANKINQMVENTSTYDAMELNSQGSIIIFDGQRKDVSNLLLPKFRIERFYPELESDEESHANSCSTTVDSNSILCNFRPEKNEDKKRRDFLQNDAFEEKKMLPDNATPTELYDTDIWDSDSFFLDDENEEELNLEVERGVNVKVRGSAETRRAVLNWNIIRVQCCECSVYIHCIADAEYILCPLCRCISPLWLLNPTCGHKHGVGLGFQSCPLPGRQRWN